MTGTWNTREDVAEDLEECLGWLADPEFPGLIWTRRNARWQIIDADGSSVLTVTGDEGAPGYSIPFGPNVRHFVITKACNEAAADCQRCGTACEGDCMEPDGVTVSVDGDGTLYSRTR